MHLRRHLAPFLLASLSCLIAALPASARDKTVWNYDGGIFLETDGSLPDGTCFRVAGHVSSGHFFDDLKRIDDKGMDTVFRRGKDTITEFPDKLLLAFQIYDFPCSPKLQQTGSRTYLTRAVVSELRLSLYWKHGLELRRLTTFTPVDFTVVPIYPYNSEAKDLPEKFQWRYALAIPSVGIPLTDSLVLVIHAPDGRVAARVAARM